MMRKDNISRATRNYFKFGLWIVAGLTMVALLMMNVLQMLSAINSVIVAALFSLVTLFLYGLAWKYVARHSDSNLSMFYLAGSALRMVLAGMVVLVAYFLEPDYAAFRNFALLFVGFYLAMLAYDAWFFARFEKHNVKV